MKLAPTPLPQGRSRVKEYPGGNTATIGSRIAFLKTLCPVPKFVALANLVDKVVSKLIPFQ